MTSMNRYNKVMNKIKVTPEMHERIKNNIEKANFEEEKKNIYLLQDYKKYFSIVACLMVCVVGTLFLPDILRVHQEPPVQVVPSVIEHTSKGQLSKAVGFDVKSVNNTLFDVEQVEYISYEGELAQIIYFGSGNELIFRMSKGNGDISGNYSEYEQEKIYSQGNEHITIKGSNGAYSLATWNDGEFAYTLELNPAVSEEDLINIIQSIK